MTNAGTNRMGRRLTILGGPHDGDVVASVGPEMRMPRPQPITYTAADAAVPVAPDFPVDRYLAQQDDDGRWWYVKQ